MAKRGQVIVDDYLRRIVSGELAEGALLPTETAMIEQYEVSRTAVREAVQTLAHKGFVRIRQGSGSSVAPRSAWNVLDRDYLALTGAGDGLADNLTEASDILDPAIAGLAATHVTPTQIDQLRALVEKMSMTTKPDELARLDAEFHTLVADSTANLVLLSLLNSITALAANTAGTLTSSVETIAQTATWSGYVVDAIASGDVSGAQDAMRMHLRKLHRF